ncbi:MAG: penicillin-binding protein [Acidimicrobiales bacterium]
MRREAACPLLLVVVLVVAGCSYTPPDVAPEIPANAESSAIYAGDGTLITVLHAEENRQEVPLDRMPEALRDAVIAIEDDRYWEHNGVDLRAVLRAITTNASEGEIIQGASTITMQVVKNTLSGEAKTLEEKIEEAALAVHFERSYTKDFILELYLNTIYFGNGAYGVQAAAHEYFGKPVDELALHEAALLAGLIQSPNGYDPFDFPAESVARRNVVLDRMRDERWISAAEHEGAADAPLALAPPPDPSTRYAAAHFVEEIKQWILDDPRFGVTPAQRQNLLFAGGLRVHTTIDLRLQGAAEAAVAAVLPDPNAHPDAALVAVEPLTGYVRAMVGGRDFFGGGTHAKYNLAMGKGRPTGSSFKPFVLAAALRNGIPLSTTFPAPPTISLAFGTNQVWDVDNYGEGGTEAPVDLVEATVRSYNTAFAQLVLAVGPDRAVDVAATMGIRPPTPLQPYPSAVLGANDVRVLDMASAYGTIANRGVAVEPVMVTRISRTDGTILYENQHLQARALPTVVADQVTGVLQQVVERGTGTAARIGRPVAGKTGTGQLWTDAWFCGFTPQLAAAVWVGFGQQATSMVPPATSITVTGGSWPAQIWQQFMIEAMAPLPVVGFPAPAVAAPATTVPPVAPPPPPAAVVPPAPAPPVVPGPPAPAPPPPATATVPYVIGMRKGEAVAAIDAAGLVPHVIESGIDRDPHQSGPGTVVSQWPAGGTVVPRGTRVTVTVR